MTGSTCTGVALRLMICGKMGSGKSTAADYLVQAHGAQRWSRSDLMKRLAHVVASEGESLDSLLVSVLPDPDARDSVESRLLRYRHNYQPELGKPRQLYQDVAQIVMDENPLAFERELTARMEGDGDDLGGLILIDDVRSRPAFDWYVSQRFSSVRIVADDGVRRQRMLARDGYLPSEVTFEHSSESDLDCVRVDVEIVNNDSHAATLFRALDDAVEELSRRRRSIRG